jgi:hypothetical protein
MRLMGSWDLFYTKNQSRKKILCKKTLLKKFYLIHPSLTKRLEFFFDSFFVRFGSIQKLFPYCRSSASIKRFTAANLMCGLLHICVRSVLEWITDLLSIMCCIAFLTVCSVPFSSPLAATRQERKN